MIMDQERKAWRKEDEEKCEMPETCGFRRVAGAILSTLSGGLGPATFRASTEWVPDSRSLPRRGAPGRMEKGRHIVAGLSGQRRECASMKSAIVSATPGASGRAGSR
jgi:hypothetical protein